jgi:hypothetical protein
MEDGNFRLLSVNGKGKANFRLFAANGIGKRMFFFLGRQRINDNCRLLIM